MSRASPTAAFALLAALAACTPRIDALDPASGPERTLVEVEGATAFAQTFWDAGTASEVALPGGFLAASLFSVPAGAVPGPHDVQLRQGSASSNIEPFTVTAPQPFPGPRLDRISLAFAEFTAADLTAWLYVQAANADVGAEVLIDGVPELTLAHRALRHDLRGIDPNDFAFPIYHHLAFVAPLTNRPLGSTISVQVRNPDGQLSASVDYALPAAEAELDSDGDDLLDTWEIDGFDADGDGIVDVDLPALGADPLRPDILVELDVMSGLANPPTDAVFTAAIEAFADAPIVTPLGATGINLILDTTGSVAFSQTIDFDGATNPAAGFTNFYDLKAVSFDNALQGPVYHYAIWANARPNGSSGRGELPGDDLIVSFDDFSAAFQTVRSMSETLVHELGHNLAQRHGGVDDTTHNPTYSSVMSYSWQLRTGRTDLTRLFRPIYAPLYYDQAAVVETGGALPADPGTTVDYSDGMGREVDENALDEPVGLYNGNGIDWNLDGDTDDLGVAADVNINGTVGDVFVDFANWPALDYTGPRVDTD